MGLMCSLRGHDWSERELEDERDERGNEVVLTVREYEVCSRCDSRNLVSENTEVTTVENGAGDEDTATPEASGRADASDGADGADPTGEDDADTAASTSVAGPTADEPTNGTSAPVDEANEDVAVAEGDDAAIIVDAEDDEPMTDDGPGVEDGATIDDPVTGDEPVADDEPTAEDGPTVAPAEGDEPTPDTAVEGEDAMVMTDESSATEEAPPSADASTDPADVASDPGTDAAADDGVILPGDDEPTTDGTDRGHGEWPERDEAAASEASEPDGWPEHEDEDDGYDARTPDDESTDVEFGGGLSPEAGEDAEAGPPEKGHDAEFVDDATGRAPERESEASSTERSTDGESMTGITSAREVTAPSEGKSTSADAQLVCPACGNAESRSRTSLRAGDICPECKRGYLAEADE